MDKTLEHLRFSSPDPFSWLRWHFECLKTAETDVNGPSTNQPPEVFFARHHMEAVSLVGYTSGKYDVREAYERARNAHEPLRSPHGFFRSLVHSDNLRARQFLEAFGPLHLPHGIYDVSRQVEVNLSDFWLYHRRFCLVAQMSEAGESRSALLNSWRDAYKHHKEVASFGPLGLGDKQRGWYDPPKTYYPYSWPWQFEKKDFESWGRETPTNQLRDYALQLVGSELNLHLSDCEIIWERCWEPTKAQFRQSIRTKSLWSSIWQLFGLDTCQGAWRRCPHCQKYFYPRRKDQFYCNSRQQSLASKRDYASRKRAEEQEKARRHK